MQDDFPIREEMPGLVRNGEEVNRDRHTVNLKNIFHRASDSLIADY